MQVRSSDLYNFNALRPGQQVSVVTTLRRVQEIVATWNQDPNNRFVSFILPTRYGKSTVIRLTAAELIYHKLACCAIVLSPSANLVEQMVDNKKIAAMLRLVNPTPEFLDVFTSFFRTMRVLQPNPFANGEGLLSVTTQLVQRNLDAFVQLVKFMTKRTGLPVLLYVDECHTGSTENEWGKIVEVLSRHGAICILSTATACRTDGKAIYGFKTEILSEEDIVRTINRRGGDVTPGKKRVETWAGVKHRVRLKADSETTLRDAWEENPLPIAKVECLPFDINLREIDLGDADPDSIIGGQDVLLSQLSFGDARSILGRVVRDPIVIEHGVRVLVSKLRQLRQGGMPIQGLVYSGNDRVDDPGYDAHARRIHNCIQKLTQEFRIGISTSTSVEDIDGTITQFQQGVLDILIVKMRASLGLDIEPLKIVLDLSPIRTAAAWIQRLMRSATVYRKFHGILITPDDIMMRTLWQENVIANGGEMTSTDLEKIDEYEVDDDDNGNKTYHVVTGTTGADFGDCDRNHAKAFMMSQVDEFRRIFPGAVEGLSHAAVAVNIQKLRDAGIFSTHTGSGGGNSAKPGSTCGTTAKDDDDDGGNKTYHVVTGTTGAELETNGSGGGNGAVYNTDAEVIPLRKRFRSALHKIVCLDRNQRGLGPESDEDFKATAKIWSGTIYRTLSVPFVKLQQESDISKLQRLANAAERIYADLLNRGPNATAT